MTNEDKKLLYAHMAGFVDADGSISVISVASTRSYVPKITVCNCKKEIVDLFSAEFGGKVRKRTWKNKNWRPNYEWSQTCKKATAIIDKLKPYLVLKKEQAEIACAVQEFKSERSVHPRWHKDLFAQKQEKLRILKNQVQALNKRGVQTCPTTN